MRAWDEITKSRELKVYGTLLALGHFLSGAYWLYSKVYEWLHTSTPVCWTFIPQCSALHQASSEFWKICLLTFCTFSFINAALFLSKFVRPAIYLQIFLMLFHIAFVLLDYRLRLNQHIILTYLQIVFLFAPNALSNLKALLVLIYITASWLKLSPDWLTGVVLPFAEHMPIKVLEWGMAYIFILESIIVLGLLSRNKIIFWICFIQFILFHIGSIGTVGFFYPLLMLLLICAFLLERKEGLQFSRSTVAIALCFLTLQILPKILSADPALSGTGRLYAIHMFDAATECENTVLYNYKSRVSEDSLVIDHLHPRIHCDPSAYLMRAREKCRELQSDSEFLGISLSLNAKRASDTQFHQVLARKNICTGRDDE